MSWADIPDWLRELVIARDGQQCQYCRMRQRGQGARFHIDHIWPQSRGGPTEADNLAVQCISCSLHKSTKVVGTDPLTGAAVPLSTRFGSGGPTISSCGETAGASAWMSSAERRSRRST